MKKWAILVSDLIPGGHKITPTSEIPIITADFTEWAPTYTGQKFAFIHCDFPYGINTDKETLLMCRGATTIVPRPIGVCLECFATTSTEYVQSPHT